MQNMIILCYNISKYILEVGKMLILSLTTYTLTVVLGTTSFSSSYIF